MGQRPIKPPISFLALWTSFISFFSFLQILSTTQEPKDSDLEYLEVRLYLLLDVLTLGYYSGWTFWFWPGILRLEAGWE